MAKTQIANVIIDSKINTAYVSYSTGTEKIYPANKLPKTVQAWLDAKAEEEKREAAAEKRRTAFAMRDRHEDVTTYTEWNDHEVRLTEEELTWFHETADRCKAATGCTVPITTFDHEIFYDDSGEALGQCITNNPDNPMEGDSQITIDNWFIHEKYLEAFMDFPCIEPQTLIGVICHEIAHLYLWEHGEDHDRKTQELMAMVEAYEAAEQVSTQVSTQAADLPAATAQKPELTVPVRHRRASEAVAFGICIAFAILAHGLVELASLLSIMIETGWTLAVPRARAGVRWIRETGYPTATAGFRTAARQLATAVWYLYILVI